MGLLDLDCVVDMFRVRCRRSLRKREEEEGLKSKSNRVLVWIRVPRKRGARRQNPRKGLKKGTATTPFRSEGAQDNLEII